MDPVLALSLLSQAILAVTDLALLCKRVSHGEEVTDAEMAAAKKSCKDAVAAWDEAAP